MAAPWPRKMHQGARVVPLEAKDQWAPIDNIRSILFMIVRQKLDESHMQSSLDTLIREHIPLLGGKILPQQRTGADLEYHIPQSFAPDAKLFQWTRSEVHQAFDKDTLFSQENAPDAQPVLLAESVPQLELLWTPADWPKERKHDKTDTPLFLVHVTAYTNATVVATNVPHAVCDQMGYAEILRAWMAVAAGQTPEPFLEPAPGSFDLKTPVTEEEQRDELFKIPGNFEKFLILAAILPPIIMSPSEQRRVLFIPIKMVERLRDSFNKTFKEEDHPERVQLSSGDVVSAIMCKLSHYGRKRSRDLLLSTVVNARGRHPAIPAGRPYLHNCAGHSPSIIPMSHTTRLSDVARRHRLAVRKGSSARAIERRVAVQGELHRRRQMILLGNGYKLIYNLSNWSAAWHGIDLSPVVLSDGTESEDSEEDPKAKAVTPIILGHALERRRPTRYNGIIMSRAEGGFWCDFTASSKRVKAIEKALADGSIMDFLS